MPTPSISSIADVSLLESPVPKTPHSDLPSTPDFSFMEQHSREMLSSAYSVIHQMEGWHILANFDEESFMFARNPNVSRLMDAVAAAYSGGHSGSSISFTMRQLEYISNNGFSNFKNAYLSS
jgi:hypothetical protein